MGGVRVVRNARYLQHPSYFEFRGKEYPACSQVVRLGFVYALRWLNEENKRAKNIVVRVETYSFI